MQSAVCEVLDYICRRDMRYVTEDESYASVLGRLQGDKSGLIRVHKYNGGDQNGEMQVFELVAFSVGRSMICAEILDC